MKASKSSSNKSLSILMDILFVMGTLTILGTVITMALMHQGI